MTFIEGVKNHKATFFFGLIPLLSSLAVYIYMDFSTKVENPMNEFGITLMYIVGILGVIGLIGMIMGPKIDSQLAKKRSNK